MSAAPHGNRPKGTGVIRRRSNGVGWEAYTPFNKALGRKTKKLGNFDFYHQAEKALMDWIAANTNAERKVG